MLSALQLLRSVFDSQIEYSKPSLSYEEIPPIGCGPIIDLKGSTAGHDRIWVVEVSGIRHRASLRGQSGNHNQKGIL